MPRHTFNSHQLSMQKQKFGSSYWYQTVRNHILNRFISKKILPFIQILWIQESELFNYTSFKLKLKLIIACESIKILLDFQECNAFYQNLLWILNNEVIWKLLKTAISIKIPFGYCSKNVHSYAACTCIWRLFQRLCQTYTRFSNF